jgi:HAE1 family hydrophobic/amphiphilic exporter-1
MRHGIAVFLLATAVLAAGEQIAPPRRLGAGPTERRLTLRQAVETAIRSNLDVAIERTNVEDADQAWRGARGGFDPVVHWQSLAADSNSPSTSVLDGANGVVSQRTGGQTLAWHQKTSWNGLAVDAQFGANRISSANPYVSVSPFYSSLLTVAVTQPLVRGRAVDAERAMVKIRRIGRSASAYDLETRAIDVASRVEQAYWDLVAARRSVDVDLEAANLAQTQLEQNRRMIAAGTLPQVELSAAEAELQSRLDDLYRSTGVVTEAEDTLKTLLVRDRQDSLWNEEIVPVDDRAAAPPAVIELAEAEAEALSRRPELKQLDANTEANDVTRQQNADLLKPQVNLVASYSLAGLAGHIRPTNPLTDSLTPVYQRVDQLSAAAGLPVLAAPMFGTLPGSMAGGLGGSLSSLFGGNYQSAQAGIALDFTVHNRAAEANLASAAIAGNRLQLMRTRAEQTIEAQVRDALQALDTARQRIRAAQAGALAASDKLSSETRLFAAGASTNFLVLTRQNEYSAARRRLVDAETAFWKAVSKYQAAVGTTLKVWGMEVE